MLIYMQQDAFDFYDGDKQMPHGSLFSYYDYNSLTIV